MKDGRTVSEIYGTYAGYCDFDGIRYFDARHVENFINKPVPKSETVNSTPESLSVVLPSDCTLRADSVSLLAG